ncbi:MAG TPA: hypothetical protein DCQ43_06440 [Treponema sp.]|nr:hypothetical protein [Treponema sp.]HBD68060.1 hypothetical protein [Treponema sp.]
MDCIQNVIEYYDELFPVTDAQKEFYEALTGLYPLPAKILRIGCGTGLLEHTLARKGCDVTGIESSKQILNSANLRRRNQLMSIRFFLMNTDEMKQFLGKGFYNIISILNDRIINLAEPERIQKLLADCRELLTDDGTLVVGMHNFSQSYDEQFIQLPVRESIRVKLFTEIHMNDNGEQLLCQNLETGNGRMLPVTEDVRVYPLPPDELISYAKDAGFGTVQLFSDFKRSPFTGSEPEVLALLS